MLLETVRTKDDNKILILLTSAGEAIRAHKSTIRAAVRAFAARQELARNTLGALDVGGVD